MTRFTKETLRKENGYLFYVNGVERKFVARFKYMKNGISSFASFLTKNFTVEEYFAALDGGESPLKILQAKGYLQPHIKKWLKRDGYEVSVEGFKQFVRDQAARYEKV